MLPKDTFQGIDNFLYFLHLFIHQDTPQHAGFIDTQDINKRMQQISVGENTAQFPRRIYLPPGGTDTVVSDLSKAWQNEKAQG